MTKLHKKDKKMIGILLSENLYNRFVLLMLSENTSKTKLGECIIEAHLKANKKAFNEDALLARIKDNIYKEWKACKSKNVLLSAFKEDLRVRLTSEGLAVSQIQFILDFEDNEKN